MKQNLYGRNSNCRARHPGKLLCFQQSEQETGRFMPLACHPVIAHPQGEAIHASTLDCFTLRVRNDVRDNLNCTHLYLKCPLENQKHSPLINRKFISDFYFCITIDGNF
jgi:hypothetical protein